jgi:hypothetical protein
MTLKIWLAFCITASESEDTADPPDKLNNEHIASRDCDERILVPGPLSFSGYIHGERTPCKVINAKLISIEEKASALNHDQCR